METLVSVIAFFIVFGSILFLAYVTTKYIGNKNNRIMKGKHMTVMETVSLGFDSRLHLVKVGKDIILISSAGKNLQMLKTIEIDGEKEELISNNPSIINFSNVLNKYLNRLKTKNNTDLLTKGGKEEVNINNEGEVFKSNIERLKTIGLDLIAKKTAKDGDEFTNDNKG